MKNLIGDRSFCVVGNAPTELDTGNGSKIDSFDIVFRFNNFTLGDKWIDDYGAKTTHWVQNFANDILNFKQNEHLKKVCPLPLFSEKFKNRYKFTNTLALVNFGSQTEFIPIEYFQELLLKVPNPSTGIAFIWWLHKDGFDLTKDNVFGFSGFDMKIGSQHYFTKTTYTGHDGELEKKLLRSILN